MLTRHASVRDGESPAYLSTPVDEAMRTVLAEGVPQSLLLAAHGHTYDAADPKHPGHGKPGAYMRIWPASDPMRALTGTAATGMVTPPLLVPVEGRDGKHARPVLDPHRAMTTRNETALLIPYYGRDNTAVPSTHAMPTVTTEPRHALLVPAGGTWNDTAIPTSDPMRVVTTREGYGLVMLRGSNTAKPVTTPMDTVAAGGLHHALADLSAPAIEDCLFRMLEPAEYAAGMAFPTTYLWKGNKRERVKMAGNAVTPPMSRDLGIVARLALEEAA